MRVLSSAAILIWVLPSSPAFSVIPPFVASSTRSPSPVNVLPAPIFMSLPALSILPSAIVVLLFNSMSTAAVTSPSMSIVLSEAVISILFALNAAFI